jgi:hypothetical protein
MTSQPSRAHSVPLPGWRIRGLAAAALLAGLSIAWSATPLSGGGAGTRLALIVAIGCAVLSLAQVALGDAELGPDPFDPPAVRFAGRVAVVSQALPWAEGMTIAVLVLEALHPARAWHTGLLGVALLAYLLANHLAETRARPRVLAPQLPVIAAGIGLLALAVGANALPAAGTGAGGAALRVVAVVAAVIVASLVLPF